MNKYQDEKSQKIISISGTHLMSLDSSSVAWQPPEWEGPELNSWGRQIGSAFHLFRYQKINFSDDSTHGLTNNHIVYCNSSV
jgi:hypothetical protein